MKKGLTVFSIALFSYLFLVSCANATDITGAFGIQFGQNIGKSKITGTERFNDKLNLYTLVPPILNSTFIKYGVVLSPKSHRVFLIQASSREMEALDCSKKIHKMAIKLSQKYGVPKPNYGYGGQRLEKDGKHIDLYCVFHPEHVSQHREYIRLQYYDSQLWAVTDRELNIHSGLDTSKEADTTGL